MYEMSEFERANRVGERDDGRVLKSPMRVAATKDGWIQLQGERTASCSACAAKSGCGVKGMAEFIHRSPSQICVAAVDRTPPKIAYQTAGRPASGIPAVGDEVIVSISGNEFLQLTMLAYLLPAAALAATACLSALAGLGDLETAVLALIAFAISFLPLKWREQAGGGLTTLAIEAPRQTRGKEGYTAASPPSRPEADGSLDPRNGNRK